MPAAAAIERQADPPADPTSLPTSEERSVLVIDDDTTALDLLSRTFRDAGLRVVTATGADEALSLARSIRPCAITLDVVMPGIDGWEVLSQLKADPETRHIPVIMVSMTGERDRGYTLGAAEFLTKPIDRGQLVALISRYRSGTPPTALVVDDEPEAREVMRRTLEREQWTVVEAENGRAALDRMAEQKPSVILLDLMMPVMDGFEFLSEIRASEAWRAIPVVVVTAKELDEAERAQLAEGAAALIRKQGSSREQLFEQIRQVVERLEV